MEKGLSIDKRIEHLEKTLTSLKLCTQPVNGHDDPGSIDDCWNEVDDAIKSIKSKIKRNTYYTWISAFNKAAGNGGLQYDRVTELLGVNNFHYLPEDNKNLDLP